MAVTRRYLKAGTRQTDGAVRAPLFARHLDAEAARQHGTARTRPRHVGTGQIVRHRRGIDLRVMAAVVLLLDPGLRGQIQGIQAQVRIAFEQRHQAPFNASPEGFLLGVLIRRIWQRWLMQDTQRGQARGGFLCQHGRAVVGHQGARQAALH